jgi:hypothetical protein
MAESLVKKIEAVKIGLEVFGVEKRLTELENRPQTSGSKGGGIKAESDPIFSASEAALLVEGDKAKIDAILDASTYVTTNTVQNIVAQKTMQADFRIQLGKKLIFES